MIGSHPIALTEEELSLLISIAPCAAHTRDVKTTQYAVVNQSYAYNQAFSHIKAIQYMKAEDLYEHRRQCLKRLKGSLSLEIRYQNLIEEANHRVENLCTPYSFQVCTLAPTGFIYIANLYKIPLLDRHQRVKAIWTFSHEITPYVSHEILYKKYQNHYPSKQAVLQFLRYIEIEHYFSCLPTQQEVMALVLLSQDNRSKGVARRMKISNRTVEEYKSRLRAKLKSTMSLDHLLIRLRQAPFEDLSEAIETPISNMQGIDHYPRFYKKQENPYAPFEPEII